jgi:regulator of protease activity HflC (stomatin/prohibitin superfamily)
MAWLILTILLGIVAAICVFVIVGNEGGTEGRFWGWIGLVVSGGIWILLSIIFSISTLSTGQVGLVYNFAGKLTGVKDSPGVIWKAPWTSIRKESVQIQREDFPLSDTNAAVTKDQQEITADLAINYEVDPQHVFDLYKNVGSTWKQKLIDSRVLQDFKEVTATYHTVDITNHREGLRKDTLNRLRHELAPYSITVTDFFIQNIGFSKAYQDAITAKQVQVQRAQQAEAKVAQATAEANQAIQKAKGEAEAIRLQGRALRQNPEVLKLRAIENLNPKAQVIFCANASCPSFLGSLVGSATGK